MMLNNSQKSRIKKILDESPRNNYNGPMTFGTYFWVWIATIPFWFFSSCERGYEITFHTEISIGIPIILFILMIVFHFKSREDVALKLLGIPAIIAVIFSILNLFSSLQWFHNFFPIF